MWDILVYAAFLLLGIVLVIIALDFCIWLAEGAGGIFISVLMLAMLISQLINTHTLSPDRGKAMIGGAAIGFAVYLYYYFRYWRKEHIQKARLRECHETRF